MRTPNEQLDGLDSDLAAAGKMIESLRQKLIISEQARMEADELVLKQNAQLAERNAEIAELKNNVTICVVCIRELRQQLSAKDDIIRKFRRAIGDHCAPNDCYATGPLTGNAVLDLVECPACSAIAAYEEALTATEPKP